MTEYLEVYFDDGWCIKNEKDGKNVTADKFASVQEAEDWGYANFENCWIDHILEGHSGKLMSMEEWKSSCDCDAFIDYDGYGDLVNSEFKLIGVTRRPSDYTKGRKEIPENAEYILWYNR